MKCIGAHVSAQGGVDQAPLNAQAIGAKAFALFVKNQKQWAASPLTAFLIGPLTQFIFIPLMTTGAGADAIGDWFGRGEDRGIALVFTLAGVAGVVVTLIAFNSGYYRQLTRAYAAGEEQPAAA